MFHTAEIRWIAAGKPPPEVEQWFLGGRSIEAVSRVDVYLVFPGVPGLGVKRREGRLEIKARQGDAEPVAPGPGIRGQLERWVKWSVSWERGAPVPRADGDWVGVEKSRRQRLFAQRGGAVQELAGPADTPAACAVELASVAVGGEWWWTLAFEAPSGPERAAATAVAVARHLLAGGGPPGGALAHAHALSYPAWLCGLPRRAVEPPPGS